jgi:hypothetical protein
MSGAVRCIVRLRDLDPSSPLKSPRRIPVSDRLNSNSIIYIPAGDLVLLPVILLVVTRRRMQRPSGAAADVDESASEKVRVHGGVRDRCDT